MKVLVLLTGVFCDFYPLIGVIYIFMKEFDEKQRIHK